MKKIYLVAIVAAAVLLSGCDALKGQKGDKGDTGVSQFNPPSFKAYRGKPFGNPYYVSCPELIDLNRQIVLVYAVFQGVHVSLPAIDSYSSNLVALYPDDHRVGISTVLYNGSYAPSALYVNGVRGEYLIEIYTFDSTESKRSAASKYSPNKSVYDSLIYGVDMQ